MILTTEWAPKLSQLIVKKKDQKVSDDSWNRKFIWKSDFGTF